MKIPVIVNRPGDLDIPPGLQDGGPEEPVGVLILVHHFLAGHGFGGDDVVTLYPGEVKPGRLVLQACSQEGGFLPPGMLGEDEFLIRPFGRILLGVLPDQVRE